ncbi:MAG: hypothetical protein MJ182_10950 [Treponema sp.]|nr:hypothetical protein [Treponema sp.]
MTKIDFEKWDKLYVASYSGDVYVYIINKATGLLFGDEVSISEAFQAQKNSSNAKSFRVATASESIEAYTLARLLNDELKICSDTRDVQVYGHLDHYITRKPLTVEADFTYNEYAIDTISFTNQVYFLEDVKPELATLVEYFRKGLYNLLRLGTVNELEDLFDQSTLDELGK